MARNWGLARETLAAPAPGRSGPPLDAGEASGVHLTSAARHWSLDSLTAQI